MRWHGTSGSRRNGGNAYRHTRGHSGEIRSRVREAVAARSEMPAGYVVTRYVHAARYSSSQRREAAAPAVATPWLSSAPEYKRRSIRPSLPCLWWEGRRGWQNQAGNGSGAMGARVLCGYKCKVRVWKL